MVNTDVGPLTYEPLTRSAARTGLSVEDLRRCIATGRLNAYRCGSRIIRVNSREVDGLGEERNATPIVDEPQARQRFGEQVAVASALVPRGVASSKLDRRPSEPVVSATVVDQPNPC